MFAILVYKVSQFKIDKIADKCWNVENSELQTHLTSMDTQIKIEDKGILLSDKSATLICARKKKEIILDKINTAYIDKPIFLCGDKVYGIIILNEPAKIEKYQFKNRFKRHMITEEACEELWPGQETLYAYGFRIKRIFKDPIDCDSAFNKIGFIDDLDIELEKRKKYTMGIKEIDYYKHYNLLEKIKSESISKKGYESFTEILLNLYKSLLNRMELKTKDNASRKKKYCTAGDRKAGRCSVGQIYRHHKFFNYDTQGFIKQIKVTTEVNFVRARLREPSTIVERSFRTITLSASKGIKAIIGKLKTDPSGPTHVQSVLFKKDKWTETSARQWVKEHKDSLKSARYVKCKDCEEYFELNKLNFGEEVFSHKNCGVKNEKI